MRCTRATAQPARSSPQHRLHVLQRKGRHLRLEERHRVEQQRKRQGLGQRPARDEAHDAVTHLDVCRTLLVGGSTLRAAIPSLKGYLQMTPPIRSHWIAHR